MCSLDCLNAVSSSVNNLTLVESTESLKHPGATLCELASHRSTSTTCKTSHDTHTQTSLVRYATITTKPLCISNNSFP